MSGSTGGGGAGASSTTAPPQRDDTAVLLDVKGHKGNIGEYVAISQDGRAWVEYLPSSSPAAADADGSSAAPPPPEPRVCEMRRVPTATHQGEATVPEKAKKNILKRLSLAVDKRVNRAVEEAKDASHRMNTSEDIPVMAGGASIHSPHC